MLNTKITYVVLLFLLSSQIFSQIDNAREAYSNSEYIESINLYNNWLKNNYDSEDFSSILLEVSELHGDIHSIIEILENNIENISDRNTRKILYNSIAQMYELSSDLHNAQVYYQKSALLFLDGIDAHMLLKSAEILILEGNLYLAESQLNEISSISLDQNILEKAHNLKTILNILNAKNDSDSILEYSITPESLYISYLIAKSNSKSIEMNRIKKQIIENFKTSPEAGLISNKFEELPDILTVFGLLKQYSDFQITSTIKDDIKKTNLSHNFMIQTGSFRDQENAHYLSKDLQDSGFFTTIEEQTINNIKYYKVILYLASAEEIEKTLLKLKNKGFDGFPIY